MEKHRISAPHFGWALLWAVCSCGGNAERTTPSDPVEALRGCSEPLVLGEARVAGPELQVVWSGESFAVGWIGPAGYELRSVDGAQIVASRTLAGPLTEEYSRPQLLWNASRLELYYPRLEGVWLDVLDGALELAQSAPTLLPGPGFRAVALDDSRVALRGSTNLLIDGSLYEAPLFYASALGFDGESFLASSVLGHGEWNFRGSDLYGQPLKPAFDFAWAGYAGTGSAGGSALASSYESGQHAAVVATLRVLTVLIEGAPPVERALVAEEADASIFWDGEEYVVLLADASSPAGNNRAIGILTVSVDGAMAPDADVLSAHSADERFPVGAAAGPGDYGIAWVRGAELVFSRCLIEAEPLP